MTAQAPRPAPYPTPRLSHPISHIDSTRNIVSISHTGPSQSSRQKANLANDSQLSSSTSPKSPGLSEPRPPSPSYFGLIVDASMNPRTTDTCPRELWCSTTSIRSFSTNTPKPPQIDANPEYDAFRKQATESHTFNLGHGNLTFFASSPKVSSCPKLEKRPTKFDAAELPSPKSRIPARDRPNSESIQDDSQQILYSLVNTQKIENLRQGSEVLCLAKKVTNTHTSQPLEPNLPNLARPNFNRNSSLGKKCDSSSLQLKSQKLLLSNNLDYHSPEDKSIMAPMVKVREVIEQSPESSFLLLDLRVFPQYSQSRIKGALNLCIPTTLLKRPSFNLQKLNDTFTNEFEKKKFSQWPITKYIIVYDSSSTQKKDAVPALNTLKKFLMEGWKGTSYILQGGFREFAKTYPSLIDTSSCIEFKSSKINLSIGSTAPSVAPVAGGCVIPYTKNAANPFFSNIRQNQDLIGGVGQMDIKIPSQITTESMKRLPKWLIGIADRDDHGKRVSHKYLRLEQEELAIMTKALSSKVLYGSPSMESKSIRLAGIEKGNKNRYNNIWPFEHSRVKLLSRPKGGCDYVNASHIKASGSNKRYIASQGPLPTTFEDFWSVIWEQGVQVIVMLTAELEDGQLKCHNYWSAQTYGQFSLEVLSEKKVPLEVRTRNEFCHRRATIDLDSTKVATPMGQPNTEVPHATIRKFALSRTGSTSPVHEITQIHYYSWPDFGAPASPTQLLGLVELSNHMQRTATVTDNGVQVDEPEGEDVRPMLVHCSAGCGRTGTFCTVDSVIDILKRQRKAMGPENKTNNTPQYSVTNNFHSENGKNNLSVPENDWEWHGDMDLVERTVEDFRSQRLSMVQNLRQFVLCYETVLEWIAQQVTRGQKPNKSVLKSVSSVAFGFGGSRDRYGSVF